MIKLIVLGMLAMGSVTFSQNMVDLVSGNMHNCVLTDSGNVYCWGINGTGELGIGSHEPKEKLQKLDFGNGIKVRQLATGTGHTCVILDNDQVKCWGINTSGHLGLGSGWVAYGVFKTQDLIKLPPVALGETTRPLKLALGGGHSCVLFEDGKVKCWGANSYGQLGLGDKKFRGLKPEEMGNHLPFVDLGGKAIDISLGHLSSCAIMIDKSLKCWGMHEGIGSGASNHLGDEPNEMGKNLKPVDLGTGVKALQMSSGQYMVCVLTTQKKVKCFGKNRYGSLGQGLENDQIIGTDPSQMGDHLPYLNLGEILVKSVSCGSGLHCCALFENNGTKCWGFSLYGQLGNGNTLNTGGKTPLAPETPFAKLNALDKVAKVTVGGRHTCVLLSSNEVKCWGYNKHHQLGWIGINIWGNLPEHMGPGLVPVTLP